jgi:transposase
MPTLGVVVSQIVADFQARFAQTAEAATSEQFGFEPMRWSSLGARKQDVYFLSQERRKEQEDAATTMMPSKLRRCAWPRRAAAARRQPQQLGISPKLLYRWQQAKLVAEVARHSALRQLRAQLKRAEQELAILKKPCDAVFILRGRTSLSESIMAASLSVAGRCTPTRQLVAQWRLGRTGGVPVQALTRERLKGCVDTGLYAS